MSQAPKAAYGNTARPAVARSQGPAGGNKSANSGKKSDLVKLTGMFATDRENMFEVRITPEIMEAFQSGIQENHYLKAFINVSEKTGVNYITLAVKPFTPKA